MFRPSGTATMSWPSLDHAGTRTATAADGIALLQAIGGPCPPMSHASVFFLLLMRCRHIADGPAGVEGPVDVH